MQQHQTAPTAMANSPAMQDPTLSSFVVHPSHPPLPKLSRHSNLHLHAQCCTRQLPSIIQVACTWPLHINRCSGQWHRNTVACTWPHGQTVRPCSSAAFAKTSCSCHTTHWSYNSYWQKYQHTFELSLNSTTALQPLHVTAQHARDNNSCHQN
jgi:hypothetical protein